MTLSHFGNTLRNHTLGEAKIFFGCLLLALMSTAQAGNTSDLKIETIHTHSGSITSATVKQINNKIYVSGRVHMNQPSAGAHVDVYLIDKKGQSLERKKDRLIVTSQKRDRTQGGLFPYAVSFDNSIADKASSARVVYCSGVHNDQG